MPLVGFEPTISAGERPKTYDLDRTATGTGARSAVARPKSLIAVFSVSVNREKLLPYEHLTLFLSRFILKLQLLTFKKNHKHGFENG
jgi:hypothetical protein